MLDLMQEPLRKQRLTTEPGTLRSEAQLELTARFDIEFPSVSIIETPTAIEKLSIEGSRNAYVKREDLTSKIYGGNKVRKLSYLIGDAQAQGTDALITTGGYGSHHVLATAIHGQRFGFDVHAVLTPQTINEHVVKNIRCGLAANLQIHRCPKQVSGIAMAQLAKALKRKGKTPYLIPHGGSSTLGVISYVEAGLEMETQFRSGVAPEPETVVVALGSGATAVGLAIGLAAGGIASDVIAVRSTPKSVVTKRALRKMMKAAIEILRAHNPGFPDVIEQAWKKLIIDHSAYGSGYGIPTADSAQAMARGIVAGIELDPTYTSKAFSTYLKHTRKEKGDILFMQTYSSADLRAWLETAPRSPRWLRQ